MDIQTKDMNDYNTGGPVDNWALSELGDGAPPNGVSLGPVSGILTIIGDCIDWADWSGEVTATNSAGSAMVEIVIFDGSCF